ncbi:MAG: hypothetical protein FWE05_06475 [Defluviitaleaceae bacterium]|nr:hypothetical protein [Defluviitaleaceae bacterium]
MIIQKYDDFVKALLHAGFSLSSGKGDGIYAIVTWNWNEEPPYETPVSWHTEDPETDPWEWRMRVLDERDDIAYGKLFFKKSGFITKAWYPYFLAARRGGANFKDFYTGGSMSHFAKRIYEIVADYDALPVHDIKRIGGFVKEDKPAFDRALVELQMGLFITVCGSQMRLSKLGVESAQGMPSSVFCTTEKFFGENVFKKAASIDSETAFDKIRAQILNLNPLAEEKKIVKFIFGQWSAQLK